MITAVLASVMIVIPVFATPTIDDMQQDKAEAQGEVEALQQQLSETLAKISTLEENLVKKQEEIDKASADLEDAIRNRDEQYDAMKLRIKYMYEEGDGTFLETLLSAKDFSDLVNKAEYIQNVHSYDRDKFNEFIAVTEEVEKLKVSLEEEAVEMRSMQDDLETEKAGLNATIENKQEEIAQLDQSIQEAIEAQRAAQQAAAEEAARQEAARQAAQQQAVVTAGGGTEESGSGGADTYAPPQGSDGWAVVSYARQFIGNPYVYGGNSLTDGIDCSGFTQQIYAAFGVSIGRTSWAQESAGVEISLSQAQAGDLIVYEGHVGIYNGSGGLIHASSPSVGIIESSDCQYRTIKTVRRVL